MPETLGRCDRQERCQYWSKPTRSELGSTSVAFRPVTLPPPPPPSYLSAEVMAASVKHGQSSTFAHWMQQRFGNTIATDTVKRYHIGTSKHWEGANVFWQVDASGRIRGGKVMQYDATGHRVKVPTNRVTWVHSVLKLEGYNLCQCYFGEHLLPERPSDPVAIVESEKTAIVASVHIPSMVWIATGGKQGKWKTDCTFSNVLKGRKVVLFPDLGAFEDWQTFAHTLQQVGAQVKVNDLLEKHATESERAKGLDLADYLLREQPKATQADRVEVKPEPVQPPQIVANNRQETAAIDWNALNNPEPWELNPF
jgi:hypothetical protein